MFLFFIMHYYLFLGSQNEIINFKNCADEIDSFSVDSVELNVNILADFNNSPSTDTKAF